VQDDTPRLGLIPSPVYRPDILDTPLFDTQIPESDQLASDQTSYDLRNDGKVSPVRNQGYFGTCWAFATYGSLESTLMPANPTPDFSEKNLANLAGFPGSSDPNNGGDIGMSAAYLARWNGPVNESTDPYPSGAWTTSGTYPPVYHIQNIVYFPGRTNRSDTANIKEALTRWGAVFSAFYWANTFYNSANTAYYQPPDTSDNQPGGGGHGVTIVGWDDTFAASNFNTPPPGNGAWLAKNSWGTGWGRSGYFYISYYDKYFGSADSSGSIWTTAVVLGESTANYDTVYDYDRQGEVRDYSYATTRTGGFANVFTANTTETVTAIGFYTTDVNVTCNISIYTNPTSGPVGGAPVALYNTTLPYMGYNTVTLPPDQRVPVTAGTNFSVVLQVTNPTNTRYIPVEENLDGYSGGITSEYGQGYLRGSTGWVDLKTYRDNSHVCVKAYTRSTTPPPVANFTANGTVINQSATVFIGEEGLNLTHALNQAQGNPSIDGVPPLTTIAWWASGSSVNTTSPTRVLDLNGRYRSFNISPTEFVGYTGTWYVVRADGYTAEGIAFVVVDPRLDLRILDFTHAADVTGQSVPQNTRLGFGIVTNMYPAVDDRYRSPINAATDGYITITVKNATGSPMQSLYNNSASTGTLAGPHSLRANFVDTQPWAWGGNDTWAWQTGARELSNQYAYPPGTYTVSAESTLNNMKANYRFHGADYTGKTVSPPYTITLRVCGDFNGNNIVDIGDTARVAHMVVGLTPVDMAADFNAKGTVDAGDAAKITWFLVGKVPAL
jgi:C1A family cysteine protease